MNRATKSQSTASVWLKRRYQSTAASSMARGSRITHSPSTTAVESWRGPESRGMPGAQLVPSWLRPGRRFRLFRWDPKVKRRSTWSAAAGGRFPVGAVGTAWGGGVIKRLYSIIGSRPESKKAGSCPRTPEPPTF
jgi:hypothetical protein